MSTLGTIYNNTVHALRTHSEALARLQEQVASGARVLRASDDTAAAERIMSLTSRSLSLEAYISNLDDVTSVLEFSHNLLTDISGRLTRVRELLSQVASGTYGPENRAIVAPEIDALLESVVSSANAQNLGRYVFAGADALTRPYEVRRTDGRISAVEYRGSDQDLDVPVGPGLTYSGLMVGEEIFRADQRQAPVFLGRTGLGPGLGTSTVSGDVWVTVSHTSTEYAGASGIAPGEGSAFGDTILGVAHTLTIDAPGKHIRLDDGQDVSFVGTETDLRLENADGDVVFVDVTGLDAAFAGTVQITANGVISIDDGASDVPITFESNQAVSDARSGGILYVNTANVRRVGTDPVRVPGTYDLFGTLIEIRDLMMNSRQLPEDQQVQLLGESLKSLEEVDAGVNRYLTTIGGRLQAMDGLKKSLGDLKSYADDQTALLQDADIVQVATQLARTQTLYEMTLATSSRLLSLSLLDFIK